MESSSVSTSMRRPECEKWYQYSSIEPKLAISRSAMLRASAILWSERLRQHRAQRRAAGAQHVHRMRVGRDALEDVLHGRGQAAQRLELLLVGRQLGRGRQLAVHEQVGDLLELGLLGEVEDVVAAVVQVVALPPDRAQRGVAGRHAGQRNRFLRLGSGSRRPGSRSSCCVPLRTARRASCSYSW